MMGRKQVSWNDRRNERANKKQVQDLLQINQEHRNQTYISESLENKRETENEEDKKETRPW